MIKALLAVLVATFFLVECTGGKSPECKAATDSWERSKKFYAAAPNKEAAAKTTIRLYNSKEQICNGSKNN